MVLTQMIKKADEWPGYLAFAKWWGSGNFREDDRRPFQPEDGGRAIPSLEMRALHAVGKVLTRGHAHGEDADWALVTLDDALQGHQDDTWLNYYKAKSLVACGRGNEALRFVLPVVMRNIRAGWVWSLLGQIIESGDGAKAIICYYRAINLAGQPTEVLNTRAKVARLLAKAERFAEAARQVRQALHDRETARFRIGQDLVELVDAAWFKRQDPAADVTEPGVEGPALEILCDMFPEGFERRTGVLESHNSAKELAYVVFSPGDGLPLHYRFNKGVRKLQPGTLIDLSIFTGDGRPRVVSLRVSAETGLPGFVREFMGTLHCTEGKPFGFVHGAGGDRFFVAPDLLSTTRIPSGAEVTGTAVRACDKKTGKEGWKCVNLTTVAGIGSVKLPDDIY